MTRKYNEIEVKDNMKVEVDNNSEEVSTQKERVPLQKIVDVQPKKIKRNLFGRLITGIMGPEGLPGIGTYVNEEIIKPAVKNIIYDSITSGLSRALNMDYRHSRNSGSQYGRGPSPYKPSTNYSNRYLNSQRQEPLDERRTVRNVRYGVDDYVIPDRNDAVDVIASLVEYADRYNTVSVADYYDLINVVPQFTDNNNGWTIETISQARIVPVRGGYIIKFPPVEAI